MSMSVNHFIPLWPRIILTAVFTIGLRMGLLVLKVFKEVSAIDESQRPKKRHSDYSSSSSESEDER